MVEVQVAAADTVYIFSWKHEWGGCSCPSVTQLQRAFFILYFKEAIENKKIQIRDITILYTNLRPTQNFAKSCQEWGDHAFLGAFL